MNHDGLWLLSFIVLWLSEPGQANWIGEHWSDILKVAIEFIVIAIIVGVYKERIKTLSEVTKEIKNELDKHCDNNEIHINNRIYNAIMQRFDALEDQLREVSNTKKR